MAVVEKRLSSELTPDKIALVNLVESQVGDRGYKYLATRTYTIETDTVADEVLAHKGVLKDIKQPDMGYAAWQELPNLDLGAKQLVGKNKDKYCTLISARVFVLSDESETGLDVTRQLVSVWNARQRSYDALPVHILGYTFIDVNGDKCYLTAAQVRSSDILQHAHSVALGVDADGRMYLRKVMLTQVTARIYAPILEIADTDTSVEDEEIEYIKMCKPLIGGWYTMGADGSIQVDTAEIKRRQLERLELPDGIRRIPPWAFHDLDSVRQIKLPESVYAIGSNGIYNVRNLEEINIPSRVKQLHGALVCCEKLKTLDLSGVEYISGFSNVAVQRLIVPDVLQANRQGWDCRIGVLEFQNVLNTTHRNLKSVAGRLEAGGVWRVGRIETNGCVVLGDYGVAINCTDVSALEPNLVGIASNCSFHKVDAQGNPQPWLLGSATRFVYTADKGGYRFADGAYTANKLRAVVVNTDITAVLPKSVRILQGELGESMCGVEYPNVAYASCGLYRWSDGKLDAPAKLPALRWLLPKGKILTESQLKQLEKKLSLKLPEICKRTQELFKLDLTQMKNHVFLKEQLLLAVVKSVETDILMKEYGMVYIGDYDAVLRRK